MEERRRKSTAQEGTAAGAQRLPPSCTSQALVTTPDRMDDWPRGHHGSIKPKEWIEAGLPTALQTRLSNCGFILQARVFQTCLIFKIRM